MKHVRRTLSIDDVTGERCVACGMPAETSVDLVPALGVRVPAERGLTRARVCRRCWDEQSAAMRPESRFVSIALAAVPPLLGVAAGLLVRLPDGIAPTFAVLLALVVVYSVRAALRRARAKRTPVLLLESHADCVVLQLLVPEGRAVTPDRYRAPANAVEDDDEPIAPSPLVTKWSPVWSVGMLSSALVVALGWSGTFARRPSTLLVDCPSRPARVAIDGVPFEIAGGAHLAREVEPGRHQFDITYLDSNEAVHGELEVRAGSGVLLSTDASQCYAFWDRSGTPEAKMHEHGAAYWFEVTVPEWTFEHIPCAPAPKEASKQQLDATPSQWGALDVKSR